MLVYIYLLYCGPVFIFLTLWGDICTVGLRLACNYISRGVHIHYCLKVRVEYTWVQATVLGDFAGFISRGMYYQFTTKR